MNRVFAGLAIVGLSATAAYAETLGTMTASWDGKDRTWFITSKDGQSQSAHDNSTPIVHSFLLWGNPDEDKLATSVDAMSLDFMVMPGAPSNQVLNAELHYLIAGFSDQWDASGEGQTEVTVDMFEKSETAVHVTGSFHANPTRADETREIDGHFDVTFPLE